MEHPPSPGEPAPAGTADQPRSDPDERTTSCAADLRQLVEQIAEDDDTAAQLLTSSNNADPSSGGPVPQQSRELAD